MSVNLPENAVAVTGMACRFPGATDVTTFWRNLCEGVSAIKRFERADLRLAGVAEDLLNNPSFIPACAPIPEPYAFDAAHFGIAPASARILDLQHRVFLECAWTALESSGTLAARNLNTAIFAGCSDPRTNSIAQNWHDGQAGAIATSLGASPDVFAARAAFALDLQGPAITLLAGCATSLVAIHFAVQGLLTYDCDVAVAGGAAIRHPLVRGHVFEPGGIYSNDGLCRPYDHLGSGIVSGDGVGVVVLRRLTDAIAAGDHIHAIIRGTAVTNDGARKSSFTAPSVEGQVEAVLMALDTADVDPASVGFIEGHGTATPMGDPIEIESLKRAWSKGSKPTKRCILGSVKSNMGHLDAAAGIAGFIKACLAVEHGEIPGTLNYTAPNAHSGLADSPFVVRAETSRWENSTLRRASIHSLGLGGTNAHVVLEQAPSTIDTYPSVHCSIPVVLTLSAKSPDSLTSFGQALATSLETSHYDITAAAQTLQTGRVAQRYRRVVVGADGETIANKLRSLKPPITPVTQSPRLVLVFPGDGKRIRGALGDLAKHLPVVAVTMQAAAAHLHSKWNLDLFDVINSDEVSPAGIIPSVVAQGAAVHAALCEFGIGGDLVLGQSLGELTAAVASGLIELTEALDLAMAREKAFRSIQPSGALAVNMSPSDLLRRLPPHIELSLVNSPHRCVVSGEVPALSKFAAELSADEIPVQMLELISAVHSSFLDPVLAEYRQAALLLKPKSPNRLLLSCVGPREVDRTIAMDPDHWVRHLRDVVRFDTCLHAAVASNEQTVILDIGPSGGLQTAINETIGNDVLGVVRVAPSNRETSEIEAFAMALGKLWAYGVNVDWNTWPRRVERRISLPVPALAQTIYEPLELPSGAHREASSSGKVTLWSRTWRRMRNVVPAPSQRLRIILLTGIDPIGRDIEACFRRLGHHVEVMPLGMTPDFKDRPDLVVDARALGELDASATVGAFLELFASRFGEVGSSHRLLVLTQGAFDVLGTEALSPVAAALAGAVLVAAQEYNTLDIGCVDIGVGNNDLEFVGQVLPLLPSTCAWIACREQSLWQPSVEPVRHLFRTTEREMMQDACVIIGGLGRFGRWVARWLAQRGCRNLYLVGRSTQLSDVSADAVAFMRQAGAQVELMQVDIADRDSTFQFLDDIYRSISSGLTIFHLAGAPNAASASAPISDLVRGDLRTALHEQWTAKVGGAVNIFEWVCRHPETRCVVFSSNAGALGGPSLAAYAAANAALDALAITARDRHGLDWCSIGWDGWRLPDDQAGTMRSALDSVALSAEEPWNALVQAVSAQYPHILVAKGNLAERHRRWVEEPVYSGLDSEPQSNIVQTAVNLTNTDEIDSVVRHMWREVIGTVPEDDDMDLFDQGGDSLSAMRLRIRIERTLQITLSLQEVLKNRTVSGLIGLVRKRTQPQVLANSTNSNTPDQGAERIIRGMI